MSESTQRAPMLEVADLHAYYAKSHVLHGVNLRVDAGEIVCLLGRNGVGRSTTAKAIMGLVVARGSVRFKGREILGRKAYEIAHLGVGYVPENRDVFAGLLDEGIYAIGFFFPVVPKGQARIRTQMSAVHERAHLETAVAAFTQAGRELGLIK